MQLRRADPIVQPARRAEGALETFFDPRGLASVDGRVAELLREAMGPSEADCVEAITTLARYGAPVLEAWEGQLWALIQVHLHRREPADVLLTPPLEALLRHLPSWPDRRHFPYGVMNAETVVWFDEVRQAFGRADVFEDAEVAVLLELTERFPDLHRDAMRRIRTGSALSVEAARRLAAVYEPAVIPLVGHPEPRIAEAVREVATRWLAEIEFPETLAEAARFSDFPTLEGRVGLTRASLIELVVTERRADLIPDSVCRELGRLLKSGIAARELDHLDPETLGNRFLLLAALQPGAAEFRARDLETFTRWLSDRRWTADVMSTAFEHPVVDERVLERMLRRMIEDGRRIIEQSRRLSDPHFRHERPAFRRVMLEGYRRTIGAPYLVEAVFLATPPEALHESLDFMLANGAKSLPVLVRRWLAMHPEGRGRTRISEGVLARMREGRGGLGIIGSVLTDFQMGPAGRTAEREENAELLI